MHLNNECDLSASTNGNTAHVNVQCNEIEPGDLALLARSLIKTALNNYDDKYGFGWMSTAACDTAWVALVTKSVNGEKCWLFPECYEWILRTQATDGGWTAGMATSIDGILNTAGALLSLSRHAAEPLQLQHDPDELQCRIERATAFLRKALHEWDVSSTDHVGFEIIVPSILDLLAQGRPPIRFDFEARTQLMKINDAKMSLFRPEYLHGNKHMTALHSLESFVGKIDFDRVAHHKVQGSMLGSPSSTAAYLMHASQWDEDAEAYLRHVIRYAAGQGSGGVPSAFPSTHFEALWVLSTLLKDGGFTLDELASEELTTLTNILAQGYEKEGGILGFAPNFEADVDDTAKTITCLNLLGQSANPSRMVEVFEADNHFRTYAGERDPSFTADCNALLALLHQPDVSAYAHQIRKITLFLCDYWWKSDGKIKDKWNTCYLYPSILFVEAMTDLLHHIARGHLGDVISDELHSKVVISLYQACLRPLLDQQTNGSWDSSVEETAYGLLILAEARRIAFFEDLEEPLKDAIQRAMNFLDSTDEEPSYVWIEKVSHASPLLTKAYRLATLKAASSPAGALVTSNFWRTAKSQTSMNKHVELFRQTPLFSSTPRWELCGFKVEAALFLPLLRSRLTIVSRRNCLESDNKYFELLPPAPSPQHPAPSTQHP
ncbi:hypothetical protein EJ03DRAFT_378939 [Teratosphaeria nubilosa]|uniref:Ent-kaurene synthase n=1 Tax=Teratosphaeria nubilosa TaxID=161662 RepID=A0A6G1KTT6_9PEZI|nr:hypothetical protein EJ03DRAFT_378939 [Teratosphaeria nubilosa]